MNIYIAYRDLYDYYQNNAATGGNPVNNDFRLTLVSDGIYLLESDTGKYAVKKEDARSFVDEVLLKMLEDLRARSGEALNSVNEQR